jgi:hypothetical protein
MFAREREIALASDEARQSVVVFRRKIQKLDAEPLSASGVPNVCGTTDKGLGRRKFESNRDKASDRKLLRRLDEGALLTQIANHVAGLSENAILPDPHLGLHGGPPELSFVNCLGETCVRHEFAPTS